MLLASGKKVLRPQCWSWTRERRKEKGIGNACANNRGCTASSNGFVPVSSASRSDGKGRTGSASRAGRAGRAGRSGSDSYSSSSSLLVSLCALLFFVLDIGWNVSIVDPT